MAEHLTQKQLATRLDLDVRQIRNLEKQGLPRDPDGRYPYPAAFRWYLQQKLAGEREKQDAGDRRLRDAEIRQAEARAAIHEHTLREKERETLRVQFAVDTIGEFWSIFRSTLQSLEGRLATVLPGALTPADVRTRAKPLLDAALAATHEASVQAIALLRDESDDAGPSPDADVSDADERD